MALSPNQIKTLESISRGKTGNLQPNKIKRLFRAAGATILAETPQETYWNSTALAP